MRLLTFLAASALAPFTVAADPPQCARDSQANQICVGTQFDSNVCGHIQFPGGGSRFHPVACHDIVVQKTTPAGQPVYTRVLGGESDETARQFFLDAQDNVVLIGTTWSRQFPVTPDALQRAYAGPQPPEAISAGPLTPGGDLFVTVLGPFGAVLYSTFLGSSGSDTILGLHPAPEGQVDVLAGASGSGFPTFPAGLAATPGGPVLLTFDLRRRTLLRSGYLPLGPPGAPYTAEFHSDGLAAVTTAGALWTFSREGRQRTFVSLEPFAFDQLPQSSLDPSGDLWLVGPDRQRQILIAKLTGGVVEAFRWALPLVDQGRSYLGTYLLPPFFGPDGLAYLGGITSIAAGSDAGKLQSTTPNALLRAPCSPYLIGILAVLDSRGGLKMLSYLPAPPVSFSVNPEGIVAAHLTTGLPNPFPVDWAGRPKAACVTDLLDRSRGAQPNFGVGQIVRLRGGAFGPDAPVTLSPGPDGRFPLSFGELEVDVGGIPAPILAAAPGEVVFAIPFATPEGDAVPVSLQDHVLRSAVLPISVRASAPWLVEPVWNADGIPNGFDHPAPWGSAVTLFLTGAGPYSPPLDEGQVPPPGAARALQLPLTVSFLTTGPAPEAGTILYAGPAPGLLGLAQINIQLPPPRPLTSIVPLLTIGTASAYLPSIWLR